MAKTKSWLPVQQLELRVGAELAEPLIWVSRVVIWRKPGDVLRTVPLRRGLNVVFSPEGLSPGGVGTELRLGHGAGKTLFCRLIRYCLGEDNFGTKSIQAKVGAAFPEGYVGADVHVAGRRWAVARPLGPRHRRESAEIDGNLDTLPEKTPQTGLKAFLSAIDTAVVTRVEDSGAPINGLAWLHVLSWLARDQECRLSGVLAWRETDAESRSPTLGVEREQLAYYSRLLLGLADAKEAAVGEAHRRQIWAKDQAERRVMQLQAELAGQMARIRGGPMVRVVTPTSGDPGLLELEGLALSARRKIEDLMRRLQEVEDRGLATVADARDRLVLELGRIGGSLERLQATKRLHEEQANVVENNLSALNAEQIRAALGTNVCPVCNVPISDALARGCGIALHAPNPDEVAARQAEVGVQLAETRKAVEDAGKQINELEVHGADARKRLARVVGQELEVKRGQQSDRRRLQAEISAAEKAEWLARSAVELAKSLDEERRSVQQATEDARATQIEAKDLRRRSSKTLTRFSDILADVARAVLGPTTTAKAEFDARGVTVLVDVGHELDSAAVESFKAWAFDVTAMIASFEGMAYTPAFWIHDSPREGDLGPAIYSRYFEYLAHLEQRWKEPPFQYIVTTTTEPPAGIISGDALVLHLAGDDDSQKLLRQPL